MSFTSSSSRVIYFSFISSQSFRYNFSSGGRSVSRDRRVPHHPRFGGGGVAFFASADPPSTPPTPTSGPSPPTPAPTRDETSAPPLVLASHQVSREVIARQVALEREHEVRPVQVHTHARAQTQVIHQSAPRRHRSDPHHPYQHATKSERSDDRINLIRISRRSPV